MSGMHFLPVFFGTLGCLLWCSCGTRSLTGGTSTAEDARVAGVVYNERGKPVPGASVQLRTGDYASDTAGITIGRVGAGRDTVTDENGAFCIDSVMPGSYRIEVNDGAAHAVLLTCDVTENDTLVRIPDDTLYPTGSIRGTVAPIFDSLVSLYIQIPGLERLGVRDPETGTFVIDDLPRGLYTIRMLASSPDFHLVKFDSTSVVSGRVSDIGVIDVNQAGRWPHSKVIVLNTSPSGAGVTGAVVDFPVLVRLHNDNFDFTAANADGSDIRFMKTDGAALPYEIERWDPVAGRAEVWVKIDTVRGNDSTQTFTMVWGNPGAGSESAGWSVFDTAAGFRGVWHLGENSGLNRDATVNGYNGTRNGTLEQVGGMLGFGPHLDGSGDYTEMGDVCDPGKSPFTVCMWVKRAVTDVRSTIISKSAGGNPSSSYGWLVELDPDGAMIVFLATNAGGWGDSGTFVLASEAWITDTSWHYIAVVLDRSGKDKSRLFIDGADVSLLPAGGDAAALGAVVNHSPLRLGADANGGNPWNGVLDECSISFRARSETWVRLCYMNQRIDDHLVEFR